MFEEANKKLQDSFQLLGCLLVPASDSYVRSKLGRQALSFEHRSAMLELIFKESQLKDFFVVSKAESHFNYFYAEAIVFYQKLIQKEFPEDADRIYIKYLCGSDGGNYLGYQKHIWSLHGAVVVERPNQPILFQRDIYPWILVVPGVDTDISSSALREGGYENAHKYTVASAVDYLQKHDLFHIVFSRSPSK